MWSLVSIIIIAICLVIILAILIKKFPVLAILDVDKIPGQKETEFKDRILKERLERDLAHWSGFFMKLGKLLKKRSGFFKKIYETLKARAEHYRRLKKINFPQRQEKLQILLSQSAEDMKNEDFSQAEEKLIEAIRLDNQNLDAFRDLGEVYFLSRKYHEARQTLEHALKLAIKTKQEQIAAEINFYLAEISYHLKEYDLAIEYVYESLSLVPNSPRYLDLLLELSIMKKDKKLASDTLAKLASVNPENQKLGDWKEKIASL